ncbi:hypothetical protein M758_2G180900 [Ceratodon purpureus]|nr:hypothetical protein M758_2G180900 [Ceratodon purpureus]
MGPKGYAIKSSGNTTKETSWMDRMCQKFETYCDFQEPGRGPSVIIQEIEVQFNTFGAGLRKFANEANDFVQELLTVPATPNEGLGEKVVDLPKQRDLKVVHGEQQVAKQPAKQAAAAAPLNFFDEACMKMSKKGESKEDCDTDYGNHRALNALPAEDGDKFPFGDVAWDWPQQPYNQFVEAHVQPEYQEVGQASCASLDLSDSEMDAFVKEETVADVEKDAKNSNAMVEGENQSTGTWSPTDDAKNSNVMVEGENQSTVTWSPTDDAKESQRDATSDSSLLDGWEGDDIIIDEDEEEDEPDLDDWEIV